jgi:hypothetical protein
VAPVGAGTSYAAGLDVGRRDFGKIDRPGVDPLRRGSTRGEGDDRWAGDREATMKFVCLGYRDETRWEALPEGERAAFLEECLAYGDELRRGGHVVGGAALRGGRDAVTLRHRDGRVVVTDGPFAETKEQLGGVLVFEARDLNHAIQLMSRNPGVRGGRFEIRAVDERIDAAIAARQA